MTASATHNTNNTVKVGDWVEYHGSIVENHGRSFKVDQIVPYAHGSEDRYVLYNPYMTSELSSMWNVRRESFTIIGK